MFEAEIISQSYINYLYSHCYELPAFDTNISLVTTCSDIVVICQIDIKAELFGNWFEGRGLAKGFAIARISAIYWANFESRGHEPEDVLAEAIRY